MMGSVDYDNCDRCTAHDHSLYTAVAVHPKQAYDTARCYADVLVDGCWALRLLLQTSY